MRIRRLLFVLALSLLSGATPVPFMPHSALNPDAFRRLMQGAMDTVEVKLPIPELESGGLKLRP